MAEAQESAVALDSDPWCRGGPWCAAGRRCLVLASSASVLALPLDILDCGVIRTVPEPRYILSHRHCLAVNSHGRA